MQLTISPTQALLILIQHALWIENHPVTSPVDVTFFSQERSFTPINVESKSVGSPQKKTSLPLDSHALIQLCVLGARTDKDRQTMMELFEHPLLSEYVVSTQFDVINDDAVRRFLETKLAENSLKYGLKQLPLADLNSHLNALINLMNQLDPNLRDKEYFSKVMSEWLGDDYKALSRDLNREELSADETQKISFSQEDWVKMSFLWHIWIRSYIVSGEEEFLPIKIYNQGFFQEQHRSRQCRYELREEVMYSSNVGIFKSIMPTPAYSALRTKNITKGLVLSDYRMYQLGAWYRYNYEYLVHPFVNSISGTILVQLRVLAAIKRQMSLSSSLLSSKNKLADYFRLFSALLLYGCGSHSWFEFLEPITLTAVREEFRDVPGFDELDMEYILFYNNKEAIYESIKESIQYNQHIVQRARFHFELKAKVDVINPVSDNNDHHIDLIIGVMKEGDREYDFWARHNFKYTYGANVNQLDAIYELFDNIEGIEEEALIWSSLNKFFLSETVAESCKQSLHRYIQFKISQEPSDDNDYSFLQGQGL